MKRASLKRTTQNDFISSAGTEVSNRPAYPWETADPKAIQVFNLRLPLPVWEKLKYISENIPFMTMQRFCHEVLNPVIDEKIKELVE